MKNSFPALLMRWSILALGVTLAAKLVRGIHCEDLPTLIVVVLVLSFLNAVIRPLLVLFALPFIVLTLGLGLLVINALLFLIVGAVVKGFTVESIWSALAGALIVSVTNVILNSLLFPAKPRQGGGRGGHQAPPPKKDKDPDVIDI